jgi:sensor histidine kinase YesM
MNTKRVILHISFWVTTFFLMIKVYPSSNYTLFLVSLVLFMIPSYIANEVLVNRLYKKKRYLHFIGSLLLLNFLYVLLVYGLPNTIYKNDNDDLVTIFLDFLGFTAFTSSIKIARYSYFKESAYKKMEILQLTTELSLLKAQVHPHFLFNMLNNLYGLILQKQNEQAADVTLKLSDLMRYLLESSKNEWVALEKEIKFVQDYLALEKMRLSQHVDIRLDVMNYDKNIIIAPLLFIPLVENVFKHGLLNTGTEGFAHFSLSVQGEELFFEAKNTIGQLWSTKDISGTGLANLRKRLQLIYPDRHQFVIDKADTIFTVTLQLQL